MSKKLLISEQAFRLLFESDDDIKTNIYRLANSGDITNLEMAIQLGIGQGIDIEQFLKDKYSNVIIFFMEHGYTDQLQNQPILKQIEYILNLNELDLIHYDFQSFPTEIFKLLNLKTLRFPANKISEYEQRKIKKMTPNTDITFSVKHY